VVVNPTARTYDAFVKAGSGMEVPIASNYAFRAEQVATSSVNNWGSFADTGSHTVCNVQVGTVTPTRTPTPTPAPGCMVSNNTAWQNSAIAPQTTPFEVTYQGTPTTDEMNGVTGLSLNAAAAYTDLAVITRFNSDGTIDAINGSGYAALTTVPYVAGTVYHFRVVVNPTARTYDAFVKAGSGMEVPIASNYAFRATQAATESLNNWGSFADTGSHTVCNVQVSSGP
jgi:hypothetical protein